MKKMPDLMEAIFDACYLIFDLIAGILFFVYSKGNPLFILYGVLTLTLCGGDAFHLVPRITTWFLVLKERFMEQMTKSKDNLVLDCRYLQSQ